MVALAAAGVPVIWPVVVDIVRPAGRTGRTLYASGVVPPAPVTGVTGVARWLTVMMTVGTACVAVTAPFTVRLKVAVAVAPLASVTVTVLSLIDI